MADTIATISIDPSEPQQQHAFSSPGFAFKRSTMNFGSFPKEGLSLSGKGRCKPLPQTIKTVRPGAKPVQVQPLKSVGSVNDEEGQRISCGWSPDLHSGDENVEDCSKQGHDESLVIKRRSSFEDRKRVKRNWEPLLLFRNTEIKPVHTFSELPLRAGLIKNLQSEGKFVDLSQIQKWAVPGIRKQLDVVMVGAPKSGKTLSYLLPLLDRIQEPSYFEELPRGNGPHIVIVCSNSKTCESIFHFCSRMLGLRTSHQNCTTKIVAVHGGSEKKLHVQLTNGVDILIATPLCLERLLAYSVVTNFERLTCLVMDEFEIMSENPFRHSIRVILEKTKSVGVVQKIFVSERWSVHIESLLDKYAKNYNLIITSCQNVAVYKKLVPKIFFVEKSQKFKCLMGILKMKSQLGNVVVVCEKEEDAMQLKSCFHKCRYPALVLCETMSTQSVQDSIAKWISLDPRTLLITTDDILSEYNITDVDTIIHFDIPKTSKTNFFVRYLAYTSFNDARKRLRKNLDYKLNDIIFVDDQNHNQLPHILNFIKEVGGQLPERLVSVSKEIWTDHERRKADKMLCNNLLSFGSCWNLKNCCQRHVFDENLDGRSTKAVKLRKWIKFSVLKVQDAACFYVTIKETFDSNGTVTVPNHSSEIRRKMKSFYKEQQNRRPLANFNIGQTCAVELENESGFYRGKIVEFNKLDKFENPTEVKIRLMDLGHVVDCNCCLVFELPESLSKYAQSAFEVRIAGIQPLDFDFTWSKTSTEFVEKLVKAPVENNQYWCGKVAIALRDVLLLDQVTLKRFCANVKVDICECNLQREIIKEQLAIKNGKHLPNLQELIPETKDEEKGKQKIKENQPNPQWAFFDSRIIQVKLLAAEGLQTVFLQSLKYCHLFEELEKELQEEGEKQEKEKVKSVSFNVGVYVMAKFEEKWNRGRIEEELEETYKVFFVDYGDYWLIPKENVVPIPNAMLTKLPLQAIECRLAGIKCQTETPEGVLRKLYDECENGFVSMTASVVKDDEQSECTGGRKYVVSLTKENGGNINKILIEGGFAEEDDWNEQDVESFHQETKLDLSEEQTEEGIQNHFVNLPDELFDEEDAQLFLQEFASKVFNISMPVDENKENIQIQGAEEQGKGERMDKEKGGSRNCSKKKSGKKKAEKEGINLVLKENIFTPKVLWNQNPHHVFVKVQLSNVTNYKVHSSWKSLLFACDLKGKLYVVDMKLFGAIVPEMTEVRVKTFQVIISLRKLVELPWPRLHADEDKFWWIGGDAAGKEEEDMVTKAVDSAKKDLRAGKVKEGVREKKIAACSESDFSGSDSSRSEWD